MRGRVGVSSMVLVISDDGVVLLFLCRTGQEQVGVGAQAVGAEEISLGIG